MILALDAELAAAAGCERECPPTAAAVQPAAEHLLLLVRSSVVPL